MRRPAVNRVRDPRHSGGRDAGAGAGRDIAMTATLRRSGLLVLAAAAAVTLAACGSDGTADPAPTTGAESSTTTAAPTETTTESDEPAAEGPTATETGGAATGDGADDAGAGTPAPNADADVGAAAGPGQNSGPDRSMHGPAETAFLDQIDAVGVSYPNEVAAIDAGNVTCIFMERRQPYSEVVDYIQRNLRTDAGQTGAVARAGIDHFCPEQFDYAAEAEERFRTNSE